MAQRQGPSAWMEDLFWSLHALHLAGNERFSSENFFLFWFRLYIWQKRTAKIQKVPGAAHYVNPVLTTTELFLLFTKISFLSDNRPASLN